MVVAERGRGGLYLLGDVVALQAAGAELDRDRRALDFGLDLDQVGLPGPPAVVLGVADLVARNRVFSANIAGA